LAEGQDRQGPVVARGALALLPPLRRVLLQKRQAPLRRLANFLRTHDCLGGGLSLRLIGASRAQTHRQDTEEGKGQTGDQAVVHRSASFSDEDSRGRLDACRRTINLSSRGRHALVYADEP